MPSLQTALPPELANNVIRVSTGNFFTSSLKVINHFAALASNLNLIVCGCCSFTVSAFEELTILVIGYANLFSLVHIYIHMLR